MIFCVVLTSLWSLPIYHGIGGEPHRDAVGQYALKCRVVEGHQQLLTDIIFL